MKSGDNILINILDTTQEFDWKINKGEVIWDREV